MRVASAQIISSLHQLYWSSLMVCRSIATTMIWVRQKKSTNQSRTRSNAAGRKKRKKNSWRQKHLPSTSMQDVGHLCFTTQDKWDKQNRLKWKRDEKGEQERRKKEGGEVEKGVRERKRKRERPTGLADEENINTISVLSRRGVVPSFLLSLSLACMRDGDGWYTFNFRGSWWSRMKKKSTERKVVSRSCAKKRKVYLETPFGYFILLCLFLLVIRLFDAFEKVYPIQLEALIRNLYWVLASKYSKGPIDIIKSLSTFL